MGTLALLAPLFASAAAYMKFDGVEGESTKAATATLQIGTAQTQTSGEKGGTEDINIGVGELQESRAGDPDRPVVVGTVPNPNASIEPDEIDARAAAGATASGTKKGNVEYEWKVEEGEKGAPNPGVEPDEIDVADDDEPITPDFGILLGGGPPAGGDDGEEAAESRAAIAEILMEGMQEAGAPTESISLNYEKIKAKVVQPVKLFGFIPLSADATIEIDAEQNVKVQFPWWAAFATGKDGETLGQKVFTALSNVLKTKHDTIKNSIGNIR